jgi:oxygen-independent coproporphyrinogen-3 oxidase
MKKLGRIHNFDDFVKSYHLLRKAGFENINVDLMYGIPYQTMDSFSATLAEVVALSPEHISAYGLMVEEGTPFFCERESLATPTLDDECDMYALAAKVLGSSGYSHYEISNYAKPGFESRHNLIYWNSDDYIGVGAAAHSCFKGVRYCNTDNVTEYLSLHGISPSSEQRYTSDDDAYVYAMLKLRLKDGFSLSQYEERFGRPFLQGRESAVLAMAEKDLLRIDDGRIFLTERGFYVSNAILVEIL